jgi:hypothetical protein
VHLLFSGISLLPAYDVLFYFFCSQGGAREGESRDEGVVFITKQTFQNINDDNVVIVVFLIFAMAFEIPDTLTSRTGKTG